MDSQYSVSTEWLSLQDVARELRMDYKRVREWVKRDDDPLPAVLIDGNTKQARVYRCDLNEWIWRNSQSYEERNKSRARCI